MQSKRSFFNLTVFRKNLTRFAPAWGIYLAGCLLVILNTVNLSTAQAAGETLGESLSGMALANCGYALVCALLLFGDLFNTRLCNALHAMPLRRETWFFTNLVSGVAFSLIPYVAVTVCVLPFLQWNWSIAILWLLGAELEFLFFFALAAFCVFCTGNRFAMALIYGLLNFLAPLVGWFLEVVYDPLLVGVTIGYDWCIPLSPVAYMIDNCDWLSWNDAIYRYQNGIGDCWRYLLILTVIAVVLYGVALALYKRRKLECAGDFVAVKGIGPVFLVVYTLAMGVMFQAFDSIFIGNDVITLFFVVGLAIGWFTGLMLLKRTVRVFRGKTILGFVILAVALVISFLLTWADPIGVTRWVPDAADVKAVQLGSYGYYYQGLYQGIGLTEEEEILDITDIHSQAIGSNVQRQYDTPLNVDTVNLRLNYEMKDGRRVTRSYELDVESDVAQRLVPYFSDPQAILGYEDWEKFLKELHQVRIDWDENLLFTGEDAISLAEAIKKDCEEGNMVQNWSFHTEPGYAATVDMVAGDRHFDFSVYTDCRHTMKWLEEHDAIPEHMKYEK